MRAPDRDPADTRRVTVRAVSQLLAPAEQVWAQVTTTAGVAEELRPWLRMRFPAALREHGLAGAPTGQPLGRAWLLLGGVLPVEYDDLRLEAVAPGRFVERSRLASASLWRHERTVTPSSPDRCLLTDELTLQPRRLVPAGLARAVVTRLFAHRHRHLRRRYGAPSPDGGPTRPG